MFVYQDNLFVNDVELLLIHVNIRHWLLVKLTIFPLLPDQVEDGRVEGGDCWVCVQDRLGILQCCVRVGGEDHSHTHTQGGQLDSTRQVATLGQGVCIN